MTNFKGTFFIKCINQGFNNNFNIKKILETDKSYNSDYLLGSFNYKKIDSISALVYKDIKADSIQSIGRRAEGKKVFEKCLCYFTSKELDSIAKVAYLRSVKK